MVEQQEDSIWVVTLEGEGRNPVLGVFDSIAAADAHAERLGKRFPDRVIYRGYPMNWVYDETTGPGVTAI